MSTWSKVICLSLCIGVLGCPSLNSRADAIPNTLSIREISSIDEEMNVSTGWKIINFSSSTVTDVNSVFLQGVETTGNQTCVLVQAGNVGTSSFTAQKIIPMKKGHKYDLDLIYAQLYDQGGAGYIDFNGEKIPATNESGDQHYKKSIVPTEDMNFTVNAHFTTVYPGNAYFKLGFLKGSNGVTDNDPKSVTVEYLNTEGESISSSTILAGGFGESYTTEAKKIEGYTFKEVQGNPQGKFTEQAQTVTYVYSKNMGSGSQVIHTNIVSTGEGENKRLPQTGENTELLVVVVGSVLLGLASVIALLGVIRKGGE